MTPAARVESAIVLLAEILGEPKAPADALASAFFRARRYIGASDRRAVSELVWKVLRSRRRLGWWLRPAEETARLLIGASLLLSGTSFEELGRVFSGARFGPGPLDGKERKALRRLEGQELVRPAMPDAVRFEVPDWLLPLLAARFGPALAAEMEALGQPAPLDLRVNLLRGSREDARAALAAEGIAAEPTPLSPWGLRVAERSGLVGGAAFRGGLVEIQDEGSQLVALPVGAAPGMRVADLCAGAGGKTLAMAMTMENRGHLVACDVSQARLDEAVKRLRRAGVHNVERHLLTAGDKWAKRQREKFDAVLVDAPCTGTGTWRRHPDARGRLKPADLDELLARQSGILDMAAALVRKGGRLVYATCSLLAEENEAQVTGFLARHSGFAVVPFAAAWPVSAGPMPGEGPFLVLTPRGHGTDGFFAAVLERIAPERAREAGERRVNPLDGQSERIVPERAREAGERRVNPLDGQGERWA
ncbi:MAG TPA: RsmB/NOP family class I SAM-dependent RNA methyltransferase [Acetobacteraceae bacterium]|nr:RsmB/NOP family class I SAM-dependent RNA methyltransferase [Acetobacteraceae bacterium]